MVSFPEAFWKLPRIHLRIPSSMKTLPTIRITVLSALAFLTTAPAQQTNGIAAVVNGRPILRSEVNDLNKMQEMQLRATVGNKAELDAEVADLRRKTLDTLIEQELILKEFEPIAENFKDKINAYADEHIKTFIVRDIFKGDYKEFIKQLTSSGQSYKKFYERQRTNIIVQIMRGQNVKDVGYVTSDEKQAYLSKHGEDFREGDKIKLWSITIPKVSEEVGTTPKSQMALAKEIRTKLLRGDEFATLARTYSQDSKSSNGGDWGVITKKDLTKRMAELVFGLPARKVSDVIEFEDSYYIFYVEARVDGVMKPKDEVEAELEKRVLMEKKKKAYEEWITQLKRKATIRYSPS